MKEKISDKALCDMAISARKDSYCPYSHYSVGAALLSKSGKVYLGANVENASYTPTVCAERVAFFKAICDGEREFSKIAVAGAREGETPDSPATPCGVCRQVMAEFCEGDFQILTVNGEGFETFTLDGLLPRRFDKNNL